MSPEARAICLRIRQDAALFTSRALLRIAMLGGRRSRGRLPAGRRLLDLYIEGKLRGGL